MHVALLFHNFKNINSTSFPGPTPRSYRYRVNITITIIIVITVATANFITTGTTATITITIHTGCAAECDHRSDCNAFDFTTKASNASYSCRLVTGDADPRQGGGTGNRQYCKGVWVWLCMYVLRIMYVCTCESDLTTELYVL